MGMLKFGHGAVVEASISPDKWADQVYTSACKDGACRLKTAKSVIARYSPSKYLLSHCSIIAAVDVDLANSKDAKSNYLIKPEYSKFVNNNGDAWTKAMLKQCYKTFIGAENYQEHVQIPSLSKGKIIDAALREISIGKDKNGKDLTTYYVDILVATDRKHDGLIRKIEAKELTTMSMGCFLDGTEITMADGTKLPIEKVVPGDMVLTHKGNPHPVMNIQRKWYKGSVFAIKVDGDFKTTYVTPEHPFWGFKKEHECACGCGEKITAKLTGHKTNFDGRNFTFSKYKSGHYARVVNPNSNTYSMEEYLRRKQQNSIKGKIDLSWIKAGDLKVGDLISYPISTYESPSLDATIEKARLIGYFLAEGSFVKEMIACGQENDYGVKCRICGNIYNKIATHLPVHKMNQDQYKSLFPDAPLNARINKQLIRVSRKKSIKRETGFSRKRKKIGVEFSLGKNEYDTVNAEIVSLSGKVFPKATVLRYDEAVKIIGEGVSEFFAKYCGEYFDQKRVPEEVLFWPKDMQKHIIATWILGDYASTSSKKLFNQMHYMFYRNKVWHNTVYREAHPYKTILKKKLISGDVVEKVYTGTRAESYMLQLVPMSFDSISSELTYAFPYSHPKFKSLSSIVKNSWKNVQDFGWITRKITSIDEIPYEGWVNNFEVDKDNSYIANDIAVHNCLIKFSLCSKCGNRAVDETEACEHIRYQKNNTFFDDHGVQRKIAELCGDASEPDSVKFIEASWVLQPAFTGAVLREIVEPSEEIVAKLEKAQQIEAYKVKDGDYIKAAGLGGLLIAQDEPKEPESEEPVEDAPVEEETKEDVPAEEEIPESPPEGMDENELIKWKKDLKKQVLRQITDEVVKDLSDQDLGSSGESETLDDTLIKPASLVLSKFWGAQKSWDRFIQQKVKSLDKQSYDKLRYGVHIAMTNNDLTTLKNFGYNKRDLLAVLSFLDSCLKNPLPMQIKKTVANLGGSNGKRPVALLKTVVTKLGRKLTVNEARRTLSWLKLLDYYT